MDPLELNQLTEKQQRFVEQRSHTRVYSGAMRGCVNVYEYHPTKVVRFILNKSGLPMSEDCFPAGDADRQVYASFTDGLTR